MASDFRLKEQLPALTEEIVATYTPDDAINHLGHCDLPSYTAVVEILPAGGYFTFVLNEQAASYAVTGAPGAFHLDITFGDLVDPPPEPILEQTRVQARDLSDGTDLGTFFFDTAEGFLPVENLVVGRTYMLSLTAPGFRPADITELLTGPGPQVIMVTLQELVPNRVLSWGSCKVRYR